PPLPAQDHPGTAAEGVCFEPDLPLGDLEGAAFAALCESLDARLAGLLEKKVTALAADRHDGIRRKPVTADKALERIGIRRAALALRERLVEPAAPGHDLDHHVVRARLLVRP